MRPLLLIQIALGNTVHELLQVGFDIGGLDGVAHQTVAEGLKVRERQNAVRHVGLAFEILQNVIERDAVNGLPIDVVLAKLQALQLDGDRVAILAPGAVEHAGNAVLVVRFDAAAGIEHPKGRLLFETGDTGDGTVLVGHEMREAQAAYWSTDVVSS